MLETIHALDAAIPLGLICETRVQLSRWRELPVEFVIPHFALISEDLISEVKAAGRKILVWTVNDPADMKRFAKWGLDGIISDSPEQLTRSLRPQKKS